MTGKKDVVLKVGFDADQISNQLAFMFIGEDGAQPNHPTGLFAGEIYFNEGEIFHLEVIGGGNKERFASFQILDCCIVTVPQLRVFAPGMQTRYAPPSPFLQSIGASYQLPLDFSAEEKPLKDNYRRVVQHWKHTLDVGTVQGRWDFSLVITVRIIRGPLMDDDVRVFYFDPEAQVGNGADA